MWCLHCDSASLLPTPAFTHTHTHTMSGRPRGAWFKPSITGFKVDSPMPTASGEPLDCPALPPQMATRHVSLYLTPQELGAAPGRAPGCRLSSTTVSSVPRRGLAHSRCSITRSKMNEWGTASLRTPDKQWGSSYTYLSVAQTSALQVQLS